ncbi:hypothetical protein D3C84_1286160 [compost metagenome]
MPKATPILRNNSVVERSSPSLTRKVWLAAAGWSMQVTIRSTRLSKATRLRRLWMAPKGNGSPL